MDVQTGTTPAGRAAWGLNDVCDLSAGRRWYWAAEFTVPDLSTAAQSLIDRMCLLVSLAGESANGLYLRATHGAASGNFERVSGVASNLIAANSGILCDANIRYFLEVEASSSLVEFRINGATVHSRSTNIPLIGFGPAVFKQKAVGTLSRSTYVRAIKVVGER